jgi:hypothetical protein
MPRLTKAARVISSLAVMLAATASAGSVARAAGRVVIVPVVVGGAGEPSPTLLQALAEGLKQNPQWTIEVVTGAAKSPGEAQPPPGEEILGALGAKVDEAAGKIAGAAEEAATALEAARGELLEARKKGPLGDAGEALAHRASVLLVAARAKAGAADKAKAAAEETHLLFPGRKLPEGLELDEEARGLLAASQAGLGAKLTLKTRPEGCEVSVGGVSLGKAPIEIAVLPGGTYHAEARCAAAAAAGAGAGAGGADAASKRLIVPANQGTHQELIDLEFERAYRAEGGARLRFATPAERKQLEDSYARRLGERYDADALVLASLGELSGADWLVARLYLRSGYLNREGYARLETPRANALGRYLATGKDTPGVLKPAEAGMLAAAAQGAPPDEPGTDPWYTDIPGWSFTAAGIIGVSLGLWAKGLADKKQNEADELRGDYDRQQRLYRDAQNLKFWSGVGIFGGLLTGATGIVLLAIPQYNTQGELFVINPTRGGATATFGGRF